MRTATAGVEPAGKSTRTEGSVKRNLWGSGGSREEWGAPQAIVTSKYLIDKDLRKIMGNSTPSKARAFAPLLKANLLLALVFFGLGFGLFLWATLPMKNRFAEYVREEAPLLALKANLKVLPAYGLLAVAATLLGAPFSRWIFRPGRFRAVRVPLRLLFLNSLLFLLALAAAQASNPAIADVLARYLSPLNPSADWRFLYTSALFPVLRAAFGVLVLVALLFAARRAPRATAAALLLTLGAVFLPPLLSSASVTGTAPGRPRTNVLLIGSDSLRADHLGCYGYERPTSARALDPLAKESVVFEAMTVATASTLESWATILSSQFPAGHGLRYMFIDRESAERVSTEQDLLPRVMTRAGYETFVVSNWAGNCFKLVDMGFEHNHASVVQILDVFVAEAALLPPFPFPLFFNNSLGEWIYPEIRQFTSYLNPTSLLKETTRQIRHAKKEGKPFFGVLFTANTHLPFAGSYPHNTRFVDPNYRGPNRFQIDFDPDTFMQKGFREDLTDEQRAHIINLYDGTVSEFDELLGQTLDVLKAEGVYEDTIIVVLSDHGDDLYDPQTTLGHGTSFFGGDQTTRIPFTIRFPGAQHRGKRIPWITRSVDIAPTLLGSLGIEAPTSYVGRDLMSAIEDPATPLTLPAFAETCYLFFPKILHPKGARTVKSSGETLWIDPKFRNNLVLLPEYKDAVIESKDRMIRTNRWKLIEIPGETEPIYQLYDMQADPKQQRDLSNDGLPVMERLKAALAQWWAGDPHVTWSLADDHPDR